MNAKMTARDKREAGFSVLEALVAMAMLSAALLPLLALQGQFVTSVRAMERAEVKLSINSALQAQISALNLTLTPRGTLSLPNANVTWEAVPAVETRRVRARGGRLARFETTLYTVNAVVTYTSGGRETLILRGLGWKPVRAYASNL